MNSCCWNTSKLMLTRTRVFGLATCTCVRVNPALQQDCWHKLGAVCRNWLPTNHTSQCSSWDAVWHCWATGINKLWKSKSYLFIQKINQRSYCRILLLAGHWSGLTQTDRNVTDMSKEQCSTFCTSDIDLMFKLIYDALKLKPLNSRMKTLPPSPYCDFMAGKYLPTSAICLQLLQADNCRWQQTLPHKRMWCHFHTWVYDSHYYRQELCWLYIVHVLPLAKLTLNFFNNICGYQCYALTDNYNTLNIHVSTTHSAQ